MPSRAEKPTVQANLVDALRDRSFYPHAPNDVREIQTHISWVFIAPPFVYKVKKPLSMGFLDFTTLEKRRHFCEQEVRLNSRLCPDVYLGVVPISKNEGGFRLDDDAQVVEYAVKMRELSGGEFASDLVDTGGLERGHIDRIVEKLAGFYQDESSTPEIAAWGRTRRLRISTDENFEQTEAFVGDLLSRPAFDAVRFYTNRFYDLHGRLFSDRRARGRILECHGDLHLEHIYLLPDAICIYDCIEFNERLRYIDVANDTAFLAMDLDFHNQPRLASYFIAQISRALEDSELATIVDFYKCYRAYVRAKVESFRSREEEVPEEERAASRDRASRYYRLALRYAVAGSTPAVLVVMGRVGTGKSTIARRLADDLGWEHLSSDLIRKTQAGADPYQRGTAAQRKELYSPRRTEDTYTALASEALERAANGHGSVIDATYSRHAHRDALRRALLEARVPYCFLELTASDQHLKQRLHAREAEDVISDARLEDFEFLSRRYEAPDDLEDAFHLRVSSEQPEDDTLAECLRDVIRMDLRA